MVELQTVKVRKKDIARIDRLKTYETEPRWLVIRKLLDERAAA